MLSLLLSGLLFLTACGGGAAAGPAPAAEDEPLRILATTYPVYLFTTAVTDGVEGVEVTRLIKEEISCLHDYTLTVNDMKAIEAADVIVMNGVGLEDFMEDALASSDAPVIDCSEGVELLAALGHEGHDHDTEYDPHIWMDPERAGRMIENIGAGLSQADPDRAETYAAQAAEAAFQLQEYDPHIWMDPERAGRMIENIGAGLSQADPDRAETYAAQAAEAAFQLQNWYSVKLDIIASDQPDLQLPHRALVTFHDGFQYFADAFQLDLLKAIEEEEGAEASAAEIKEIVGLIGEYDLPVIFTEKNGSDATAQAIARETGVAVAQLDMVMSGDGTGLEAYSAAMDENIKTIINALSEGRIRAE